MIQARVTPILTATATGTDKNSVIPSGVNRSLANDSRSRGTCCLPESTIENFLQERLRPGRRENPRLVERLVTQGVLRLRQPIRKRIGLLRSG